MLGHFKRVLSSVQNLSEILNGVVTNPPVVGPYPPGDICQIGTRIGHQQPILASVLVPIPMDMTLHLGTWLTIAVDLNSRVTELWVIHIEHI